MQEPLASGYHIGQCRYRTSLSTQKVLLDDATLDYEPLESTQYPVSLGQGQGIELNGKNRNRINAQQPGKVEKTHQPNIQMDKLGTAAETLDRELLPGIMSSLELVWVQMGLGPLTRAGRGRMVRFHQTIWQGSGKGWEELRPVLEGASTALGSGRLGLADDTDCLRPQSTSFSVFSKYEAHSHCQILE